jgi:hypothetical protein
MKSRNQGIEQITVRRANVADTDKVRYRVYSTPVDFIAVIAESALMAVKVSGVSKPHKIVRDLPTEGIAIEAKKMSAIPTNPEKVTLPSKQTERKKQVIAEIPQLDAAAKQAAFKPMMIADLQRQTSMRARILPPEMVTQIIEEHSKTAATSAPPAPAPAAASVAPPVPDPIFEAAPTMSDSERLLKMADAVLPATTISAAAPSEATTELSPEEVEKLLNG